MMMMMMMMMMTMTMNIMILGHLVVKRTRVQNRPNKTHQLQGSDFPQNWTVYRSKIPFCLAAHRPKKSATVHVTATGNEV